MNDTYNNETLPYRSLCYTTLHHAMLVCVASHLGIQQSVPQDRRYASGAGVRDIETTGGVGAQPVSREARG